MDSFRELVASITADGMIVRHVEVATEQVVFLKSILEVYPGIAAVHAPPGAAKGGRASLMLASTPGLVGELDAMLADIADAVSLRHQGGL